jgi:diaminohydroxyphosphoribosylaminopyrimidine deaminase/5-amino-6-(5-phosphoribosylamino)uracil reductase
VLATGYTGESDPHFHAEEAALIKLAAAARPHTLYTSLEPCTVRRSRPTPCTELILAAGILRVVFALREPLLFADCHGVEQLRRHGVEVVELADLGRRVRRINAHLLGARGPARTR